MFLWMLRRETTRALSSLSSSDDVVDSSVHVQSWRLYSVHGDVCVYVDNENNSYSLKQYLEMSFIYSLEKNPLLL